MITSLVKNLKYKQNVHYYLTFNFHIKSLIYLLLCKYILYINMYIKIFNVFLGEKT